MSQGKNTQLGVKRTQSTIVDCYPSVVKSPLKRVKLSAAYVDDNGVEWFEIVSKKKDAKYYNIVWTSDPDGKPNAGREGTMWRCKRIDVNCDHTFLAKSGTTNIGGHMNSCHAEDIPRALKAAAVAGMLPKLPPDDPKQIQFLVLLLNHWTHTQMGFVRRSLSPAEGDTPFLKEAKEKLLASFNHYFEGKKLTHFLGAFYLDVTNKDLREFREPTLATSWAEDAIRQFSTPERAVATPAGSLELPPERVSFTQLRNFSQGTSLDSELAVYRNVPPMAKPDGEWNPLSAFSEKALSLPAMARAATRLWAIPATSASSERVFSLMGRIDSISHYRLTEDKFEQITFVKANLK